MIVLDEHLQSKGLDEAIGQWYVGPVGNVTALRPGTIIKDEAIPALLARQNQPVFIAINVTDFWQQLPLAETFCLVCFALPTSEIPQVPGLLRRLLRHPDFNTKAKRAGKAVRITAQGGATYYSVDDKTARTLDNF